MSDDRFSVVIIGAGLAGLTAALHLADRGIPPLVLEADSRWPGGRLCGGDPDSFDYGGRTWAFDSAHGVHALWGGYANMRATLERFVPLELRASEGEEWINRWGRQVRRVEAGSAVRHSWIPAPLHYLQLLLRPRFWRTISPWDFLSLPGFLFSLLWTAGMDPVREQAALDGLTLADYFRGWTPNLRATFTGLGVVLLAVPKEAISLTGFIAALRFFTLLRRRDWHPHYLPANAHRCLIQPMIGRVEALGGMVMPGAEVVALERAGNDWRVIVEDSRRGGRRSLQAGRVILAADPAGAERILTGSADTAAKARDLIFPSTLRCGTVRLWFDAEPPVKTPGGMFSGDFLPDNFFWMHRMQDEFRAWHQATGGSALEMHLYAHDEVLDRPDQVLLAETLQEAYLAFPALRGHFVYGAVRRNLKTQTVFRVPDGRSLWVQTPWEGILACGDWVGYDTPSLWMERSCVTGIAAANAVLEAHGLEAWPLIPPPRPEISVRLIGGAVRLFRVTVGRALLSLARLLRGKRQGEAVRKRRRGEHR